MLVIFMKILVEPLSLSHLKELEKKDIGGFIVGIDKYSIFQNLKLNIEELSYTSIVFIEPSNAELSIGIYGNLNKFLNIFRITSYY